ncbi:hypothetical protein NG702_18890 [Pseudarthrobacter sp. MDT3-28]|uniref:hypothetical protein n=1 Tax=Pseudarthrobacter raffinosi TaxID=2953651 RepID=UPI00208F0328|nr:hypothetical protein [Pseudarthrobacter sp. MDT3-28]MCO4239447.1 hypothetical protein [Pseudarthrobacter sp. MDT3-28]
MKSLEKLADTQGKASRGMYTALGASVMIVAMSTAATMWDFLPSSVTASVLLLISFFVGLLTIVYGTFKARVMEDAARYEIRLEIMEDDEPDDPRPQQRQSVRGQYVSNAGGHRLLVKRGKGGEIVVGSRGHSTTVRGL